MLLLLLSCQTTITEEKNSTTGNPIGEESSKRFVINSMLYLNRSGRLSIYDRDTNQEVWYLDNPNDPVWPDARMSENGDVLYHNIVDVKEHDPTRSFVVGVDFAGNVISETYTEGAHHSFDILSDGSIVTIVSEIRETDSYGKVAGDRVVVYKDGQAQTILSAFSVLSVQPLTDMWNFGYFPDAHDWTHANWIRWYPNHESYLLTVPGVNAIWQFDADGKMQAAYLGLGMEAQPYQQGQQYQDNPFDIYEGGTFDMPHGATLDSSGRLWVLSNGLGQVPSYAHGYQVINGTLTLIEEIAPEIEDAHSAGLGSVEYIEANDSVLINWGILGIVEEVDMTEQRLWGIQSNIQEVYGGSSTFDDISNFIDQ